MDTNKNIRFLQAYTYFQNFPEEKPHFADMQKHLVSLSQFLQDKQSTKRITQNMLQGLMNISCITYKKISSTDKYSMEQFLYIKLIKFLGDLHHLFLKKCKKEQPVNKNIYAILFSGNMVSIKKILSTNNHHHLSLLQAILQFNQVLMNHFFSGFPKAINQFYPGLYSSLSNVLRFQFINLKNMGLILQNIKLLVSVFPLTVQSLRSSYGQSKVKEINESSKIYEFQIVCLNRLIQDIKYVVSKYFQLQFNYQVKFQQFNTFITDHFTPLFQEQAYPNVHLTQLESLINHQLSSKLIELFRIIVTFSQITYNHSFLQLDLNPYFTQIIRQQNQRRFIECCKYLKVDANINLKQLQLKKLVNMVKFIQFGYEQSNEMFAEMIKLLKYMFHIKKHSLITIPYTSSNIPLQQLNSSHTLQNYPIKDLHIQYKKQLNTMLLSAIPFYQFELSLIEIVYELFDAIAIESRDHLLKHFVDQLLEYQYKLDMSLTHFYEYLNRLIIIKFLFNNKEVKGISLVSSLFSILANRTQSVVSLKPSYVQEEIMISVTLEIIYKSFEQLRKEYQLSYSISNKIRLTQSTILTTQKILNSITEPSYIIKLISIHSLLAFTGSEPLEVSLKPMQTTLLQRNKTNMSLVRSVLQFTKLNTVDYEELTYQYLSYKNCEPILLFLITRISMESCRKCILAAQKWWLLLSNDTVQYLNCKQMQKSTDQGEPFFVKDQQNAVIANALGVIILQLSDKWTFYLKSQKRQILLDIICNILSTNSDLVFFRSFFNRILSQLFYILCECLGYDKEQVRKTKDNQQNSIKYFLKVQIDSRSEFYNRLKLKIYKILVEIPKQYHSTWDKEVISPFKEVLQHQEDSIKKEYLFRGRVGLKGQYELLKKVLVSLNGQ